MSLNAVVLGISTDSIYSHKVFTEISPSGRKINFPLLSDRTQEVSKKYGVLNREVGATFRYTLIIDPDGVIQVVYGSREPVGRNIDEILRLLEAFQYNKKTGLGVPANWKSGEPGIKTAWEYVGKY